jgi:hypothetical protein
LSYRGRIRQQDSTTEELIAISISSARYYL